MTNHYHDACKITIPIITIDGPSGVGKGTAANRLAKTLGWHFLDSGAIYRLLALKIMILFPDKTEEVSDISLYVDIAKNLFIRFENHRCYLDNTDVTDAIREEKIGLLTSKISAIPDIRTALLERQRAFAQLPGLVADGRDMGSVVFPDAPLKFYLDADPDIRAHRRELQLKEKGISVIFSDLLEDIKRRDQQDKSRNIAPLVIPKGAIVIDSGHLDKEQVFSKMMSEVRRCWK